MVLLAALGLGMTRCRCVYGRDPGLRCRRTRWTWWKLKLSTLTPGPTPAPAPAPVRLVLGPYCSDMGSLGPTTSPLEQVQRRVCGAELCYVSNGLFCRLSSTLSDLTLTMTCLLERRHPSVSPSAGIGSVIRSSPLFPGSLLLVLESPSPT